MPANTVDYKLEEIIRALADSLRELGFSRAGPVMRLLKEGNCGIIQFQRSQMSNRERILFTINVGIVCGSLLDKPADLRKIRIIDAHVRLRLGKFLPGRPDKWWEVSPQTETGPLITELSELLLTKAVPYIQSLLSTSAIISLWESGQSPGLTEGQRVRLLSRLTKSTS